MRRVRALEPRMARLWDAGCVLKACIAQCGRRKHSGLRRKEEIGNITTYSAGGRGASAAGRGALRPLRYRSCARLRLRGYPPKQSFFGAFGIPREAGSCRRRRGGCRAPSEGIPNRAMRPHMRMDARSYAERGIAGGAGMRRSAADAPRATVGSTDPNAERTAAKRGGARNGCTRRQFCDCRAGRTQAPTPLFVPGVRLGRYCPQIRGKHCMDRRYEKKWVNSRGK